MICKEVLIVDYSPLYREGIKYVIERGNIKANFHEIINNNEVVNQEKKQFRFDLLIIDSSLLDTELKVPLEKLIRRKGTRTLLLSNDICSQKIHTLKELGVQAIASKRYSLSCLLLIIETVLSGGEYWSSTLCKKLEIDSFTSGSKKSKQDYKCLTNRQREVLICLVKGMLNKQIAHHLGVQENTVKSHVTQILRQTKSNNRTQAVVGFINYSSNRCA